MTDQNGNTLPYYFGAGDVRVSGEIGVIGKNPVILRSGTGGLYVRTKGKEGKAALILKADGCDSVKIDFDISVKKSI